MKKVVFAGSAIDEYCLEASYKRAFEHLGFEVHWFDTFRSQQKFLHFGQAGRYVNDFIGINAWRKKMQREFVLYAKSHDPEIILVFCNTNIPINCLAFLKSVIRAKIILVWPDTLFNVEAHVATAAPLYDGVASYSRDAQEVFTNMGFKNVNWIPLAADEQLHGQTNKPDGFAYDLCFIGNHRPERARDLESIARQFPKLKLSIWGSTWKKRNHPLLQSYIIEKPLFGQTAAQLMNKSRISLNIIDDTNYPAANMRFFETPIAYAFQLASACPEWEGEYTDMTHLAYYHSTEELFTKIERILSDDALNIDIRRAGHALTKAKHTYSHRAQAIIDRFL